MTRGYSIIRQAIIDRDQITATYQGYHREMCPHAVGTKDGLEKALFYQFAGKSRSGLGANGSDQNWRCIFIEELENVSARKGAWHTAANHSRRQTCIDIVDVEVTR